MARMIVLAKSPMHKEINGEMTAGACVVAYCPEKRKMIRLTQEPNGAPLGGESVRRFFVMDEIETEISRETPDPPQNENVLVFPDQIRRLGRSRITIQEIMREYTAGNSDCFMEHPSPIMDSVDEYDHSVELVEAKNLQFVWKKGNKRPLVSFVSEKRHHRSYRVTEPNLELAEPAQETREMVMAAAYLLVSIPNVPFVKDGKYYKFVASVLPVITNETEADGFKTPDQILQDHYGYSSFRSGQKEVIDALLAGRDSLCVMPTGQGKSICYQIPAMLLKGTAFVISPLISLMKDQTAALIRSGIPAAYINSTLNMSQQNKVMKNISEGKYKLVYVSPERLSSIRFQQYCSTIRISLIAVDEAHCVSQWGPNFRYDYLNISRFTDSLPGRPPIGAFTATATPKVAEDICQRLNLKNPLMVRTGFDRPNLYFGVLQISDKRQWVNQYLEAHSGESGIIYCSTRKTTEQLCEYLIQKGHSVSCYHGGLSQEAREKSQNDFVFDRTPVMTATNAFGMGIDKPNVSFVIHYNIPKSMEEYYQEAGRAGRDGKPADCILLYSRQDLVTNRRLIEANEPSPELTPEETGRIRKADIFRLNQMAAYAEGTECLRSYILNYFGENKPQRRCEHCSNCKGEYELMDIRQEARMILSCVARTGQQYGKDFIARILKGTSTEWHKRLGMERQTTWGIMSHYSLQDINRMITALIGGEYLKYTEEQYPVLRLTEKSRGILFGEEPFMIRKIETRKRTKKYIDTPTAVSVSADSELYEFLRQKRNEIAAEEGVPPYVILDNKTLMHMAEIQPLTKEGFLLVKGIGKIKMERYASAFLPIIQEYQKTKGRM